MRYSFDGMQLDPAGFELRRDGTRIPLEPQAFDVLLYLVRHRDRVVGKEELMDAIWGGRFVSETAVTSRIKQARRAIGDDGDAQRLIRTLHGRGYRFVGAVTDDADVQPADDSGSAPVRYTLSDGLNIAYQVTGAGPIDILLVAGFISHLEQDWGDPRHDHFLHRLGTMGRLIRFDKRGTGMSDRPSGVPDLETRMHDVLAVLDAVGSTKPYIFGYSEGGPMAALFAATHPERVAGLMLYGAYPKRTSAPDYPWAQSEEDRAAYSRKLVTDWDWEADMLQRCPSADPPMARWWARRARAAATLSTVRTLMDMNALVDVRDALAAVRVPTLVVHRVDDTMVRIEHARYLAQHIRGAQLVELPGQDHFVSADPDQILDPIERFLADPPTADPPALALAAVVAVHGDQAAELTGRLELGGGRVRRGPDGNPIVLFDGPASAVRAGETALAELPATALSVHVAEVDRNAPDLVGFGVQLASDLATLAPAGAIWASSTVRDLLAGSGIRLEPVGVLEIAGAGRQPVFQALSRADY